jgi:hypothetical protein
MIDIFDLMGHKVATVDVETARLLYSSVQYGWRIAGTDSPPS